jgi:hypothetical protein
MTDTAALASIGAATLELHLPTVRAEGTRLDELAQGSQSSSVGQASGLCSVRRPARSAPPPDAEGSTPSAGTVAGPPAGGYRVEKQYVRPPG